MDNTSFITKKDTSKMRYNFGIGIKGRWYGVWTGENCYYVSHYMTNKIRLITL